MSFLYLQPKSKVSNNIKFKVRKGIIPNNSKTLWQAVKLAKNQGTNSIPLNMTLDQKERAQKEIPENYISNNFTTFFEEKIRGIVESITVDQGV